MAKYPLTVEEVKERVRQIKLMQKDYESAHAYEDQLYSDVLRQHARDGCALAKEALKTKKLTFPRYCA